MDRTATHQINDRVAGFFQLKSVTQPAGELRPVAGHGKRTFIAQKIGCVQKRDMEHVAFDPFAAIKQPAECSQGSRQR